MKRIAMGLIVLVLVFALASCANMTPVQQSTLSGAAIGAGGGALVGALVAGRPLAGAAIGAGVGALGGYVAGAAR